MADFPELNSFGTLIRFALALEETLGALAAEAGALPNAPQAALLKEMTRQHGKQMVKLQRMAREQLNEVVLQPVEGMNRQDYLPPMSLPTQPHDAVSTMASAEDLAARFYLDAAQIAGEVLAGLGRQFRKLAERSQGWSDQLQA